MSLFGNIFSRNKIRDPLNQISLVDEHFDHQGIMHGMQVWYTGDGDAVMLYFFGLPPDLPKNQLTIDTFIYQYLDIIGENAVEAGIESVAEIPAVRAIGKMAQETTGMAYVGSYTFPFRDFSYVIKIQCEEQGMTGIRETILFDKLISKGEITLDDSGNIVGEFLTDNAIYDDEFPDHPLSRCRRGLHLIKSSITVTEQVRQHPLFGLPHE